MEIQVIKKKELCELLNTISQKMHARLYHCINLMTHGMINCMIY